MAFGWVEFPGTEEDGETGHNNDDNGSEMVDNPGAGSGTRCCGDEGERPSYCFQLEGYIGHVPDQGDQSHHPGKKP